MIDNGFNICLYRRDEDRFLIWSLERPRCGALPGLLWESRHSLKDRVPYLLRCNLGEVSTFKKFLPSSGSWHSHDVKAIVYPEFQQQGTLLDSFLILDFWKWLVRSAGEFLLNLFGVLRKFLCLLHPKQICEPFYGTEYMSLPIH